MSCGVIRAWTVAIVRDKEFDAAKHGRRYREHWARFGTDPLTAGGWAMVSVACFVVAPVVKADWLGGFGEAAKVMLYVGGTFCAATSLLSHPGQVEDDSDRK
jgi:hypothetical protein